MRTILIDARWMQSGGVGTWLKGILSAKEKIFPSQEFNCVCIISDQQNSSSLPPSCSFVRTKAKPFTLHDQLMWIHYILTISPTDIFCPHVSFPFFLPSNLRGWLCIHDHLMFTKKRKLVTTNSIFMRTCKAWILRFFLRRILKNSQWSVISPSHNAAFDIAEELSCAEPSVIMPAVLFPPEKNYTKFSKNELCILSMVTSAVHKNASFLKKCIQSADRKFNFIVVGMKRLHPHAREYVQLEDEKLELLWQKSQIYFSVSDYEGFGLPVLEAALRGVSVLLPRIPVYEELYSDLHGFYFYTPNSVEDALEKLDIALKGMKPVQEQIRNKFSYETAVSAFHNWFKLNRCEEHTKGVQYIPNVRNEKNTS